MAKMPGVDRRQFLRSLAVVSAGSILVACTPAAPAVSPARPSGPAYPTKPITFIVPSAPGGVLDLTSRELARDIQPFLSQPLSIANQSEAGGMQGYGNLLQAKPDGYTLGLVITKLELSKYLQDVPYKSTADYTLLAPLHHQFEILSVKGDAPWQTLDELIAYSKLHPGEVRAGSIGNVGDAYIDSLILSTNAGANWTFVPFSADIETLTAVLGNHAEVATTSLGSAAAQIQAGAIRPLCVFSDTRNPSFTQIPTSTELGYALQVPPILTTVGAPPNLPEDINAALTAAIKQATQADAYKAFLKTNGLSEAPETEQSLPGMRALMKQESDWYESQMPTIRAAQAALQSH